MLTLHNIIEATSKELRVPVSHMQSRIRDPYRLRARQAFCWLAHDLTNATLHSIGRYIGGCDASTVKKAIRRTERRMVEDHDFNSRMQNLKMRLEPASTARLYHHPAFDFHHNERAIQ